MQAGSLSFRLANMVKPGSVMDTGADMVAACEKTRLRAPELVNRPESPNARDVLIVPRIKCVEGTPAPATHEEQHSQFAGFGVDQGTLEVVTLKRPQCANKPVRLLPTPWKEEGPIVNEFARPWRVLRLNSTVSSTKTRENDKLPLDKSALRNYEPQFVPPASTFPSLVDIPTILKPRVAVDDASVFLFQPHIRFAIGAIESLFCRALVYDISLGCRVTEEYGFAVPGPTGCSSEARFGAAIENGIKQIALPAAIFYLLPNHQAQHLYLVLKVTKVLSGDPDSATGPYCNPEKAGAQSEQQKLAEKAANCLQRLGRYRQPLAWGAMSMMEGAGRPMTLYRQRWAISDEQRIPMITEAVRGTLKEKVVPAICEFDLRRIEDDRLMRSKFEQPSDASGLDRAQCRSVQRPVLSIVDPFSPSSSFQFGELTTETADEQSLDTEVLCCREVQPFCHSSVTSTFGLTGSGPVASSYINVLYVYPTRLDKFQHRNVAVRVQLLSREIETIGGIDEMESHDAVLPAVFAANHELVRSGFTVVSYHQKNPQFENELKICLPELLTSAHHILFTFYHIHCKKLQPNQQQQELVGYAVLPIIGRDGSVLDDGSTSMNVALIPLQGKQVKPNIAVPLPTNYVETSRGAVLDGSRTVFTCRTRAFSSVFSQDKWIADLLQPFHTVDVSHRSTVTSDGIVKTLLGLREAHVVHVRYFLLSICRFVLGYLRSGPAVVKRAAFQALLTIFEKVSWSTHRSLRPQEVNQILQYYVEVAFDEDALSCCLKDEESTQPLYRALVKEWLHVLQESTLADESTETRRVSITFSHALLQLILKSIAMSQSDKKIAVLSGTQASPLPIRLLRADDLLLDRLLGELVNCAVTPSIGLLLQKEASRSIACFCRGLFLVSRNSIPGRAIRRYLDSIQQHSHDPNTLVHLLFPFLRILIDFELFAVINGAFERPSETETSLSQTWTFEPAWLAQLIFHSLLRVVDEQKEYKIRCTAAGLLRHLFVVHAFNPRHQSSEEQQAISLAYYPLFTVLAEFTIEPKLLTGSAVDVKSSDAAAKEVLLKKELLVCAVHLLCSVSSAVLPRFFEIEPASASVLGDEDRTLREWRFTSTLSPTSALMHYRKVVSTRKSRAEGEIQASGQNTPDRYNNTMSNRTGQAVSSAMFDEVRVHACLALIHHMIDVFLIEDEGSSELTPLQRFLSPSMSVSEGLSSLQDLEYQMKQRGSHHRSNTTPADDATHRRTNSAMAGSAQSIGSPQRLSYTGSFSSASSTGGTGKGPVPRTMPRNWGKNYSSNQLKKSSDGVGSDGKSAVSQYLVTEAARSDIARISSVDLEDQDKCVANLRRIIATTALRTLKTAIELFENVLRLIEAPLNYARRAESGGIADKKRVSATADQAHVLLGSLIDLLFFLLWRASKIECLCTCDDSSGFDSPIDLRSPRGSCIAGDLLSYLTSFLEKFQKPLFACKIAGLPLIYDDIRVQQLITVACTSRSNLLRQQSAEMLARLISTCYIQTGSFTLVKGAVFKVFTATFFPAGKTTQPPQALLSTDALRDLVEEIRQYVSTSEIGSRSFRIQVIDLLNGLITQVKVFEMWRDAVSDPASSHDFEELEEGLYRIFQSLSVHWLVEQKQTWLNALIRLHLTKESFAEAVVCKLSAIEVARAATKTQCNDLSDDWIAKELWCACEYAERASWPRQQLSICEELLVHFKRSKRFLEYQDTLRYLDRLVGQIVTAKDSSEDDNNSTTLGYSFYRVKFSGESVSAHIARNEFIYKRSKFTSLGDFVGELKAMLRSKYPVCERVSVVPDSKPFGGDDQPNVIFIRVGAIEKLSSTRREAAVPDWRDVDGDVFSFATPFTLSSSAAYGKTAEQCKRVTYLSVPRHFPCMLNRQVVARRLEILHSPIEASMDDIRKRCDLLRAEIQKEMDGKSDIKTLTLVLKGSVDTHVHGGIPEVIESFLTSMPLSSQNTATASSNGEQASVCCSSSSEESLLPVLLAASGKIMGLAETRQRRHELASLLVEFAVLCCRSLLISRAVFRRTATNSASNAASSAASAIGTTNMQPTSSFLASEANFATFLKSMATSTADLGVSITGAPRTSSFKGIARSSTSSDDLLAAALPEGALVPSALVATESPLQQELERSFASLVQLMHAKIRFDYATASVVPSLLQRMERLHMGSPAPPAPGNATPEPLLSPSSR